MRKLSFALLALLLALWLPLGAFAMPAEGTKAVVRPSPQKLRVDGAETEAEAYNINGRNYIKLRDVAYLLKDTSARFDIAWDAGTQLVSVTTRHNYTAPDGHELEQRGDMSARAKESRQTICINGGTRSDLSVWNIGGSNFFQIRELGAALGFGVEYDEEDNAVEIILPPTIEPVELNNFLFLGDSLISNPHWNANLWGRHGHSAFAGGGAVIPQFFGCTTYPVFVGAQGMGMQGTLRGHQCSGVAVLLGANDLGMQEAAQVEANYLKLIEELRGALDPSVPIFILAVYPVNMCYQYFYGIPSVRIERTRQLNTMLANDVLQIDGVWFADGTGPLLEDNGWLTVRAPDGLHIHPNDYDIFYDGIAEALYATGVVVPLGGKATAEETTTEEETKPAEETAPEEETEPEEEAAPAENSDPDTDAPSP